MGKSTGDDEPSLLRAVRTKVGAGLNWIAVKCSRDPRWYTAEDWRVSAAGGFQTPAKVCPRGCGHETARRELVTRSSLGGQARVRVRFAFETETCPTCGSRLVEYCGRCKAKIVAPVSPRCRSCGLPQPWSPDRLESARRTRPRRWKLTDARDPAILIHEVPGSGELFVIDGDVTSMAVDCVVSNDDVDGRMYTVIASALKAVAGPEVERQSIAQGPYPRGSAWYTDAGALPAPIRGIIHVAAMDRRGDTDEDTIVDCVRSAFHEARKHRLTSLALAAFGTGPRGRGPQVMDLKDWLAAVGETVVSELAKPVDTACEPLAVVIVLYQPEKFDDLVAHLRSAADKAASRCAAAHHRDGDESPRLADDRDDVERSSLTPAQG